MVDGPSTSRLERRVGSSGDFLMTRFFCALFLRGLASSSYSELDALADDEALFLRSCVHMRSGISID